MQLLVFNEECLVSAIHQIALITSLPFVHTARRSYRLGVLVKCSDWQLKVATLSIAEKFIKPSHLEEGEVVTRFPLNSLAEQSRPERGWLVGGSSILVRAGHWQHCRIAGSSLQPSLPSQGGNTLGGQANSLGYGKNVRDWMIRSQASKQVMLWKKVQRLSGSGPIVNRLKIESGPAERQPWDERPNQSGAQGTDVCPQTADTQLEQPR